jgi:hypothetical protein
MVVPVGARPRQAGTAAVQFLAGWHEPIVPRPAPAVKGRLLWPPAAGDSGAYQSESPPVIRVLELRNPE